MDTAAVEGACCGEQEGVCGREAKLRDSPRGVAVEVLLVSSRWCCDGTLLVGHGTGDQGFGGTDGACNWNTKRIEGKSGGLFHARG